MMTAGAWRDVSVMTTNVWRDVSVMTAGVWRDVSVMTAGVWRNVSVMTAGVWRDVSVVVTSFVQLLVMTSPSGIFNQHNAVVIVVRFSALFMLSFWSLYDVLSAV